MFGSDDFVADIGAVRTKSASELMYARQKLVNVYFRTKSNNFNHKLVTVLLSFNPSHVLVFSLNLFISKSNKICLQVTVGKAFELQVIDLVHIDYKGENKSFF